MRIPTEHFGNIPVLMLTPQAFSPREEDDEAAQGASLPRQLFSRLQVSQPLLNTVKPLGIQFPRTRILSDSVLNRYVLNMLSYVR